MPTTTNINQLVKQIVNDSLPLSQTAHDTLLENNRSLYAALLNLPGLADNDAMQIVTRLLAVTEDKGQPIPLEAKQLEDKLIAEKLPHINIEIALNGLKTLVNLKVNNQRTSGWIKSFILGSPKLETWAVTYRRTLAKLLRHAMGKQVAQTCIYFLQNQKVTAHQTGYLATNLYKYQGDNKTDLVKQVFLFVFNALKSAPKQYELLHAYFAAREDITQGSKLPYRTLRGIAATYFPKTASKQIKRIASKTKVKRAVVVGEMPQTSDTLVGQIRHYYLTGDDSKIVQKVLAEADRLPFWDAHVALIMDVSHSMKGVGARAYNNLAIAIAIREVLQQKTRELSVVSIGTKDAAHYPTPDGTTNLANALLTAYEKTPDVILVITDGYENVEKGDTSSILKVAKTIGLHIPVLHVLPAFTVREAYTHRQPLGDAPVILETGEQGFLPLWLRIQLELQPDNAEAVLKASLQPILN